MEGRKLTWQEPQAIGPGYDSGLFRIESCYLGRGVFATRRIEPGEAILVFSGTLIRFQDTLAKGDFEANPIQIGDDLYLDTEPPGVYVNHSCCPNAGLVEGIVLTALQVIESGEQITFDYSTTMDEDHWEMECLCGSETCRGVVRDFKTLPDELRRRYRQLGVVSPYLVERHL